MPAVPDSTHRDGDGEMAAAVSNAVVHLLREYTGRGPTRAKTHVGEDLYTVVLQQTLTTAERRLVDHGEPDSVLHTRGLFQDAMRTDLVDAVERISGRTVMAFMSANHLAPDIAVETFVLEPVLAARRPPEGASERVD